MRDDDCGHAILIIKIVIEFLEIGLPIVFLFDLFGIVIEVEGVGAGLQFLEKLVSKWGMFYLNSLGRCLASVPLAVPPVPGVVLVPAGVLPGTPGFCGILLIQIK